MAANTPFEQLTGALKIHIAPYGEAIPEVQAAPTGNWTELGATDGDQKLKHGNKITWFRDNDHQGLVKGIRTEEEITISATLVDLTLEKYARIISSVGSVVETINASSVTQRTLPMKRGPNLTEYAVLFRGDTISPYGVFPGMYVFPKAVVSSEPTPTFGKDKRAALDFDMTVLEDDAQSLGDEMGWLIVQVS
jgi:hypothetical protein